MEKNKQEQGQRWKDNPKHMQTRQSEIVKLKYDNPDINIQDIAKVYDSISELRKPSQLTEKTMKTREQAATTYAEDATKQIVAIFDKHSMNSKIFDAYYLVDAFMTGCAFERTSEPIRQTDEELVKKIGDIIWDHRGEECASQNAASEIYKLLSSSRCQENDVNVELLDALKIARDRMFKESGSCPREVVIAILDAEKKINK